MESTFSASSKNSNTNESFLDLITKLNFDEAKKERSYHLKQIVRFSASYYVFPLFLLFWIADLIYYNNYKWEFLLYRLTTVVGILSLNKVIQKIEDLIKLQIYTTIFILFCSTPITIMVYRIGDLSTGYYAGLNLVMIGMASGFRFTNTFFFINVSHIILPYLVILPLVVKTSETSAFWMNSLFLIGTAVITTVSRFFKEHLHLKEFKNRQLLEFEVSKRGEIIEKKTKEAVDLSSLAKQFSPQVVQSIRDNNLDINKPVHRSEICVIFIDIVGSTERFLKLDREDLHKILSMYIEDSMSTLLKYDITIDKFLGDGILGFSNDPAKHNDYIERVLKAAFEIQKKINSKKDAYEELWLGNFEISIGISSGYASVGFYGNDKYFKSYTAIGRVVNLASRLGSSAKPNQILVSNEIKTKILKSSSSEHYKFFEMNLPPLKGFESDLLKIYELSESEHLSHASNSFTTPECPHGHGLLFLDTNDKGIYIFKCRSCDHILNDIANNSSNKKVS